MESSEMGKLLEQLRDLSLRLETLHGVVEQRFDSLHTLVDERCSGIEHALLKVCPTRGSYRYLFLNYAMACVNLDRAELFLWRNWLTRDVEGVVPSGMWVRVPPRTLER